MGAAISAPALLLTKYDRFNNRDVTTKDRSDTQGRRLRQGRGMVALAEIRRSLAMRRASQLRSMLWNFERLMAFRSYAPSIATARSVMNGLIYLIGLIVVIMAVLSFLGLH